MPHLFSEGYLIYRIRGVGMTGNGDKQRQPGIWSVEDASSIINLINTYPPTGPNSPYIEIEDAHFSPLNWQYTAAFAEEGKRKDVVSYYDGTLRNRQTVTKINTNNKVIVGEQIYDYLGRPAIQVLPVPSTAQNLEFHPKFNQTATGEAFSWQHFDVDGVSNCDVNTESMSTASGASRYYSNQNPNKDGINAYLPDAEEFPFTHVEYEADNTGRIRRQGGLGPAFQLSPLAGVQNRETFYYYGVPYQKTLNSLFGLDAGYARYYKKQVVRDPNRQLSVTYYDAHDRVVATSLAGDKPGNLEQLSSNSGPVPRTTSVLTNRYESEKDEAYLISTHRHVVTTSGVVDFDYAVQPNSFDDCLAEGICYDCVYDLTISVLDECGTEMLGNHTSDPMYPSVVQAFETTIGPLGTLDNQCDAPWPNYSSPTTDATGGDQLKADLDVGTYTVIKELRVNTTARNYYFDAFLGDDNACIKSFDNFYQEALDSTDFSGCEVDSCELGCLEKWGSSLPIYETIIGGSATQEEYVAKIAECKENCIFEAGGDCKAKLLIMRSDVSPGGQYAAYSVDVNTGDFISTDPNSVLNVSNTLPPGLNYTNLFPNQQDFPYDPNMSVDDFIKNWDPNWADVLVMAHPEYASYNKCTENTLSRAFDLELSMVNSYAEAEAKGYIMLTEPHILDIDPYFDASKSGQGASDKSAFDADLISPTFYSYTDPSGDKLDLSLGELILIATKCTAETTNTARRTCLVGKSLFNSPSTNCDIDQEWILYRTIYLAEKRKIMAQNGSNYNLPLGTNPRNMTLDDFDHLQGIHNQNGSQAQQNAQTINSNPPASDHCTNICEGYRKYWEDILNECPAGAFTVPNSTVVAELEALCEHGCTEDIQQFPLGSGSLPASGFPPPPAGVESSIEAIFIKYESIPGSFDKYSNTFTTDCNSWLIEMPPRAGRSISASVTTYPELDICGCDKILENHQEFVALSADPTYDKTAAELFFDNYGFEAIDLAKMTCACNEAFALDGNTTSWSKGATWPASAPDFLNGYVDGHPFYVQGDLTCDHCITCAEIKQKFNYYSSFNNFSNTASGQKTLTSLLNHDFNVNLTYWDYESCIYDCDDQYLPALRNWLESVHDQGDLLSSSPIDLTASGYNSSFINSHLYPPSTACPPIEATTDVLFDRGSDDFFIYDLTPVTHNGKKEVIILGKYTPDGKDNTYRNSFFLAILDEENRISLVGVYRAELEAACDNEISYSMSLARGRGKVIGLDGGDILVAIPGASTSPCQPEDRQVYMARVTRPGSPPATAWEIDWSKGVRTRQRGFENMAFFNQINGLFQLPQTAGNGDIILVSAFESPHWITAVGKPNRDDAVVHYEYIKIAQTSGTPIWRHETSTLNGNNIVYFDHIWNTRATSDGLGGVVILGKPLQPDQDKQIRLERIDASGSAVSSTGSWSIDIGNGMLEGNRLVDCSISLSEDGYIWGIALWNTSPPLNGGPDPLKYQRVWTLFKVNPSTQQVVFHRRLGYGSKAFDHPLKIFNNFETNTELEPTSDNGMIMSVYFKKHERNDRYDEALIKFDSQGRVEWSGRPDEYHGRLIPAVEHKPNVYVSAEVIYFLSAKPADLAPYNFNLRNLKYDPATKQLHSACGVTPLVASTYNWPNKKSGFGIVFPLQVNVAQNNLTISAAIPDTVADAPTAELTKPLDFYPHCGEKLFIKYADGCDVDCEVTLQTPAGKAYTGLSFAAIVDANPQDPIPNAFTNIKNASGKFGFTVETSYTHDGQTTPITLTGEAPCMGDCGDRCNQDLLPETEEESCRSALEATAYHNARVQYEQYIDSVKKDFIHDYNTKCLNTDEVDEKFDMTYQFGEYHFMLYYYDQAGNLVKTVPPKAVDPIVNPSELAFIDIKRDDPSVINSFTGVPAHDTAFTTHYVYNSLNQKVWQKTPDAGQALYFYDALGRIVLSQDEKQRHEGQALTAAGTPAHIYTYIEYDELGRVTEQGELQQTVPIDPFTLSNPYLLSLFINGTSPNIREVVRTRYDSPFPDADVQNQFQDGQQNLRSRIASVTYFEDGSPGADFNYATHYSYDIRGNINEMVQDFPELERTLNERFKYFQYEFDLISGNVNRMIFQPDQPDQLIHEYTYDADNRLLEVKTSRDGEIYSQDARYQYYDHGPLARVELGQYQVQGLDYVYTLQGWLKGVNSNTLDPERDPGRDGHISSPPSPPNPTQNFGRDAYGFTLGYFDGDYKDIGNLAAADLFEAAGTANAFGGATRSLYNGNIKHMVTSLKGLTYNKMDVHASAYKYDQLNRIKEMDVWKGLNSSSNTWNDPHIPATKIDDYQTRYSYDEMGNITSLKRNGTTAGGAPLSMDDLTYTYDRNRLTHVDDDPTFDGNYDPGNAIPQSQIADIDDQDPGNYTYDANGNLISDLEEDIEEITWNLRGKITEIKYTTASQKSDLEFRYDAMGNRILKIVKPFIDPNDPNCPNCSNCSNCTNGIPNGLDPENMWDYTYYLRDAQGTLITTYKRNFESHPEVYQDFAAHRDILNFPDQSGRQRGIVEIFKVGEHHIYGSSRLGTYQGRDTLKLALYTDNNNNLVHRYGNAAQYPYDPLDPNAPDITNMPYGDKRYELSNHLGNVLITISDRKMQVQGVANTVAHFEANIQQVQDYYPFGMPMPGRALTLSVGDRHRFGFQGQETDQEFMGGAVSYKYRVHDARIGRFLSVDPLSPEYPWNSPYAFSENRVINSVELEGLEAVSAITMGSDVQYRGRAFKDNVPIAETRHIDPNQKGAATLTSHLRSISSTDREGIGFVAIFSHGSAQKIFPLGGYFANASIGGVDFSPLQEALNQGEITFAEGAVVYLGGCNCGTVRLVSEGQQTFAQELAVALGVDVVAANGSSVTPSNPPTELSVMEYSVNAEDTFTRFSPDGTQVDLGNKINLVDLANQTQSQVKTNIKDRRNQTLQDAAKSLDEAVKSIPPVRL
ncbi:MAG: DUF6443 domain-containing protein [Bacteroidota bacterium]